ncbi:class A beta-lactamase-related serine hydrolase [Lactiplantibacillus garii]|uniref:Class A beta-lactamase-related serine hydrolase n=1 Tax=Lactiplantibacillus garii TaxID=2306423 RepID=A0A426DAN4_9LACO|nr:serine hydrolase domain-containing protein [Lactiplantibacillus garii]RRK11650.1 class A beta-lactamase-related serine hydrolase [Lactiplantibacillus garii]
MHFTRHTGFYYLVISLVTLGGLGLLFYMINDRFNTDKPAAKATSTTVVARKKPQPKATKTKPAAPTVVRNATIDRYLAERHFSGTALVVRNNRVILRKAYGERNREHKLPNQTTTPYYIGSAQKAIVATAILQLQDRGKLNVNDPVAKYLNNFPNGHKITLKNLLNHTSGLVGHHETGKVMTPAALVKDIKKQGINAQPGQWHYLDGNYTVLAYLVEKLSGQSLMQYLQKNIFTPAGMTGTGTYKTFKAVPNHSTGYQVKNGRYVIPQIGSLSQLFGVGNLYMPVDDMYRFDHALMTNQLISKRARKAMLTPGSSSTYGMGFYCNPGSYSSHGIVSGWNVANSFSPSGQTYIVLMANVQNNIPSFGRLTGDIYGMLNQADDASTAASSAK